MKKYAVVEVEWLDIVDRTLDWDSEEANICQSELATCFTAGYLLHKDKNRVVVCNSVADEDVGSTITIPTGCVIRIKRLKG